MSDQTNIEWCDSTFNPWLGCTKISPACDHCYAESMMDKRMGRVKWGTGQHRQRTSAANWRKPLQWNAKRFMECSACGWRGECEAELIGCGSCGSSTDLNDARRRVFCASLADVFDNEVPVEWLVDLLDLIRRTPNLDWLLLTKRVGNWDSRLTVAHQHVVTTMGGGTAEQRGHPLWALGMWIQDWLAGKAPENVWLGATICNQDELDRDITKLLAIHARVRFLSIEPMLGPVDVNKWLEPWSCVDCGFHGSELDCGPDGCEKCGEEASFDGVDACKSCGAGYQSARPSCPRCGSHRSYSRDYGFLFDSEPSLVDWVIAGGESGPHARQMHPDWVRSLRDQCAAAGVAFMFKQWGGWRPISEGGADWYSSLYEPNVVARDGEDQDELNDAYGRWCKVPTAVIHADGSVHNNLDDGAWQQGTRAILAFMVGKKAAGRTLDGRTHTEFPE